MNFSSYSVQGLPPEERPRERLVQSGAEALSSAELIAIILGSGTKSSPVLQIAHELMVRFKGLDKLAQASLNELEEIQGIGKTKAIQLKAALNLGLRLSRQFIQQKYRIDYPLHAYHFVKEEMEHETKEVLSVILQDIKGYVICREIVSIGNLFQTIAHPREVFYPAIRHKAASFILVHNHPSGDPSPSKEDIEMTRSLIKASQLMGIPLNDHLIIGKGSYISLRQENLIKF